MPAQAHALDAISESDRQNNSAHAKQHSLGQQLRQPPFKKLTGFISDCQQLLHHVSRILLTRPPNTGLSCLLLLGETGG